MLEMVDIISTMYTFRVPLMNESVNTPSEAAHHSVNMLMGNDGAADGVPERLLSTIAFRQLCLGMVRPRDPAA